MLTQRLVTPRPERLAISRYAFEQGHDVSSSWREMTGIDPWFLHQMKEITRRDR